MADVIRHKRSATAAAVPSAGQLELGELAINVADGRLYFKKSSGEIVAVANLTDAWALQPIGVPFGLWTHLAGVSTPPTDNPNYRYIKLTASDSYNTGVLTSESVSGSAPLVQATAVISDASSPMNGQTVHLINTERRVIRAGSSGAVEQDALQNIIGSTSLHGSLGVAASSVQTGAFKKGASSLAGRANGTSEAGATTLEFDASLVARTANETRVKSIGADYYMRIR